MILFFRSVGTTIAIPVAQSIFMSTLNRVLRVEAASVDVERITKVSAGLRDLVSPDQLPGVLKSFNAAVANAFLVTVATAIAAFFASLLLEWKSVKQDNNALGPTTCCDAPGN